MAWLHQPVLGQIVEHSLLFLQASLSVGLGI